LATINQLRVERRAYFSELKRSLKPADSAVEKLQRRIQRVLDRTRDLPEERDYAEVVELFRELVGAYAGFESTLEAGTALFGVPRID